MTAIGRAFLRIFFECDKRCLILAIVLMLVNTNFLVLMFYNIDRPDAISTMNIITPTISDSINSVEEEGSFQIYHDMTTLPSFTADKRDILLGAIIERSSLSSRLAVTVFLLNRKLLSRPCKGSCPSRYSEKADPDWEELSTAADEQYSLDGKRISSQLHCEISNANGRALYSTPAIFIANNESMEPDANGRIDIFRCLIKSVLNEFRSLIHSNESLFVSVHRDSGYEDASLGLKTSIINFTVPWSSRRTGFMLDGIESHLPFKGPYQTLQTATEQLRSSVFDSWYGFTYNATDIIEANSNESSDVFLCITLSMDPLFAPMAGAAASPSVPNIAQLLESIEHHLQLGFTHIFIAVRHSFQSERMHTLLLALRDFIESGRVTVASQAGDSIDGTASIFGLSWSAEFLTLYHRTTTLYLLKGRHATLSAHVSSSHTPLRSVYLAMWAMDSMLVPKLPSGESFGMVQDVIRVNSLRKLKKGQLRGLSKVGRPSHLLIRSAKIVEEFPGGATDIAHPWLKDRFGVGKAFFLNPVLPPPPIDGRAVTPSVQVKDLYSLTSEQNMGLIIDVDVCVQPALPRQPLLSMKKEFLLQSSSRREERAAVLESWFPTNNAIRSGEDISESVTEFATLYRYMAKTFRYDLDLFSPVPISFSEKDYVSRYSSIVMQSLRRRNLDLMVLVRLTEQTHLKGIDEEHWPKFTPPATKVQSVGRE